jgi:glucan 1,3-beta-glucosidase
MSVVPFATLALLNRSRSAIAPPVAEAVFAGLFAAAGFYILCNEGVQNWQSVWTSISYLLFGALLWQARFVAGTEPAKSNIFTKMA